MVATAVAAAATEEEVVVTAAEATVVEAVDTAEVVAAMVRINTDSYPQRGGHSHRIAALGQLGYRPVRDFELMSRWRWLRWSVFLWWWWWLWRWIRGCVTDTNYDVGRRVSTDDQVAVVTACLPSARVCPTSTGTRLSSSSSRRSELSLARYWARER